MFYLAASTAVTLPWNTSRDPALDQRVVKGWCGWHGSALQLLVMCENGTCFSSYWPILPTACFSASSQGFLNLSYNPWLLVGGFRIIFFFTTVFQIVQRSCWNSWLASRSGIKISLNTRILHCLLFVAGQANCCLPELLLPCRDPGDVGKGLNKDLCVGRAGDRSVLLAANSDKCCGEKHCLYLFALREQGDIYRERKESTV